MGQCLQFDYLTAMRRIATHRQDAAMEGFCRDTGGGGDHTYALNMGLFVIAAIVRDLCATRAGAFA
ncbi:hypothetical protein GGI1_13634 [Acidithiobacillus sp. GGI-221]|nr:hypothetical protein GGI1_13634 [Acidithiobacillus sp. GGI-221]